MSLDRLIETWLRTKEAEAQAVAERRKAEDEMVKALRLPSTHEGTFSHQAADGYTIKIVGRIDRKVDVDKATEIAAEYGLNNLLTQLFRWKAEVIKSAWEASDPQLIHPFYDAVTSKHGRPSFSIKKEQSNG